MGRLVISAACAVASCWALPASARQERSSALVQYLRKGGLELRRGTYSVRNITAPGKRPTLLLVYQYGRDWCGSSGCSFEVVDTSEPKPRTVTDFTAWTPVTLDGWSNGYMIIGVSHHGGGARKPYCEEVRFRPDGSEDIDETKEERLLKQKRCASSKNLLLKKDWY